MANEFEELETKRKLETKRDQQKKERALGERRDICGFGVGISLYFAESDFTTTMGWLFPERSDQFSSFPQVQRRKFKQSDFGIT